MHVFDFILPDVEFIYYLLLLELGGWLKMSEIVEEKHIGDCCAVAIRLQVH